MNKNHSATPAITDLVEKIRHLIEDTLQLAREAEKLYTLELCYDVKFVLCWSMS